MAPNQAAKRAFTFRTQRVRIKDARKRAHTEAAAGDAAGPSGEQNAFSVLPDELVQRVMSFVEARDAWEVARLQQVDRRFRRLVRGVHWEELQLQLEDGVEGDWLDSMERFEEMLDRMAKRISRKEVRGVRRAVLSSAAVEERSPRATEEFLEAWFKVTDSIAGLFAALAVGQAPLEHVAWAEMSLWKHWPADYTQRAVWPNKEPRTREEAAASLLFALSPAAGLRSMRPGLSFAEACVKLPQEALPSSGIWDLICDPRDEFKGSHVAAMVRAWPGLRRVRLRVDHAAAIRELAALESLEFLEVHDMHGMSDREGSLEEALEAIAGAVGAGTRLRELLILDHGRVSFPRMMDSRSLAAVLSLRVLESLTIGVDASSAALLGGLASLERLRDLSLRLDASPLDWAAAAGGDRGAALLRAAAAAVEAVAPRLDRLCLRVEDIDAPDERLPPLDEDGLVALLRAARPKLERLSISTSYTSRGTLREVAACGPKLQSAKLLFHIYPAPLSSPGGIPDLVPFRELLSLSPNRLPQFKLYLTLIVLLENFSDASRNIVSNWFRSVPCVELDLD